MSGGQQQRVAIARAIVGERRLILADEPTGALDTDTGEEILRLLRARCDAGAAGVLVTHEARHAAWADRVVFLRDGVVVDETGADPVETLVESGSADVAGWKPALRLARRDALRNKGRSVLVLVMIALPVLAVSAADVVYQTSDVAGVESLDRRLGSPTRGSSSARAAAASSRASTPTGTRRAAVERRGDQPPVTLDERRERARPRRTRHRAARRRGRASTPSGVSSTSRPPSSTSTSPLVDGLFRLTDGRWPASPTEVVVNEALAEKGFAAGVRARPSTTAGP